MIGQAVMRELLLDPGVSRVVSVVRTATGAADPKLTELVHRDFLAFQAIASELAGFDACLFCLGVSSAGMSEAAYRAITIDVAVAAGKVLAAASPKLRMVFVSGVGTDSSGTSRTMWARVKGAAENALLAMPFAGAYMIRPAYIQPRHGVRSRTRWTRWGYAALGWGYPVWRRLFAGSVIASDELARAMIHVARHGAPTKVLYTRDLRALASTRDVPAALAPPA